MRLQYNCKGGVLKILRLVEVKQYQTRHLESYDLNEIKGGKFKLKGTQFRLIKSHQEG